MQDTAALDLVSTRDMRSCQREGKNAIGSVQPMRNRAKMEAARGIYIAAVPLLAVRNPFTNVPCTEIAAASARDTQNMATEGVIPSFPHRQSFTQRNLTLEREKQPTKTSVEAAVSGVDSDRGGDSLQQKPSLKLDLSRSAEEYEDGDEDESRNHLLGAKNLYIDSSRVGLIDEDLTDEEITRRKRVGIATIPGLFMSIEVKDSANPVVFDLMANFKTKKNSRTPVSSCLLLLVPIIRTISRTNIPGFTLVLQLPPFHFYAKNGSATGKLVYANYGTSDEYEALKKAGVDVEGNIVLVRTGDITLPAKVTIAGKHGAAGIITYNDPADDGATKGSEYPDGPWRVSDQASFGSVCMGNGDPSTPDGFSATAIDRITVEEVFSENNTFNILPTIVSMPVSAKVAQTLMKSITQGKNASEVFGSSRFGGGLGAVYRAGPSDVVISVENKNKYSLKKVWNLLITIKGSREGDRYVIVGSQRDSLNAGAVSPGSGNAVFIEMLRAVGDLLTNGWVPHRTLLFASFGGEQFGSVGSSEWIDRHSSHLGGRGVVYLNVRDAVRGAGPLDCEAAASLHKNIYLMSAEVQQPKAEVSVEKFFASKQRQLRLLSSGKTAVVKQNSDRRLAEDVTAPDTTPDDADADDEPEIHLLPLNTTFKREDLPDDASLTLRTLMVLPRPCFNHFLCLMSLGRFYLLFLAPVHEEDFPSAKLPKISLPGSGNRISPFLARLGIPSLEMSFEGGYYGVENSGNDTIEWTKKFADPTFSFHRAAAQLYGSIMLSFSDAIFLQYDFTEVAWDLRYGEAYLIDAIGKLGLTSSITTFEKVALAVAQEMHDMSDHMVNLISGELVVDLKRVREMNTRLLMTEKAFLLPAGLPHMPWLKHALYGISEWDDYRVGYYPGVTQELKSGNPITIKRELIRLCQTIEQAADTLSTTVL
ncbi:N-acetylated-alpha-linked acidic dipeptidase-like protein, partial [Globisporangium splendens]